MSGGHLAKHDARQSTRAPRGYRSNMSQADRVPDRRYMMQSAPDAYSPTYLADGGVPYPNAGPPQINPHYDNYGPPMHHPAMRAPRSYVPTAAEPLGIPHPTSGCGAHMPLAEQHDYQMLTIPPSRIAIAPLLSRTNLYIKGLSPDTTDASLFALCSRYGSVVSAKAVRSVHTLGSEVIEGPCRGYGFALVIPCSLCSCSAMRSLNTL